MEKNEKLTLTFYTPEVPKVKGDRQYQRPTLPTKQDSSTSMSPQRRQQYMDQTQIYIRMFCASLCAFSFLMLICMSPLNWVQFLVIKNGLELYAGLWTVCKHELCWSHTPKSPYFLLFSRAFFLVSLIIILIGIGWLFSSCLPGRRNLTKLDLKVSMLCFISATCLILCLSLFVAQVRWHVRDVMESDLLWTYHVNWWSDFLCMFAVITVSPAEDERPEFKTESLDVTVNPVEKSRLEVGPLITVLPAEDERPEFKTESLREGEQTLPNAEL
ncbi:transmembrane protein 202 [Otolemur garnettii]|uniref:transmembrane protein 202 n=1 Tax=Otolemur garnettii TaxID=30611 RepID=UPI000273FCEA|nr:transmembrane protein 202 [Otolemur garnettii]